MGMPNLDPYLYLDDIPTPAVPYIELHSDESIVHKGYIVHHLLNNSTVQHLQTFKPEAHLVTPRSSQT